MDNNAFERNMINLVNTHAKSAATDREELRRRKAEKIRAREELLSCVIVLLTVVIAACVMTVREVVSAELAIIFPALCGFVTGIRVCDLVKRI